MVTTTQHSEPESPFGLLQVVTLGIFLVAGVLCAMPLYTLQMDRHPLGTQVALIGGILWVAEIVLYLALSLLLSKRNGAVIVLGVLGGVLLRLLVCMLMALALDARIASGFAVAFLAMQSELWLLRLLAIVVTAMILAIPCRALLAFGAPRSDKNSNGAHPAVKSFSFQTVSEMTADEACVVRAATPRGDSRGVHPPEGFTSPPPKEGVTGMINIPTSVIYAAVPEATGSLRNDQPVRVRLAYVIPQLPQAVVWLTWQQIFLSGADDPNRAHGPERPDSKYQTRWIPIPPQYYVSQVPQGYFQPEHAAHPAWMQRAPVPQEAQFER